MEMKPMEENEMCRTCLKTDDTSTYKFFQNVDPVLLSFCTSLEVWQEDILPKSLCTVCFELLVKFSKFKYDCIQSQNRLMTVAFDKKSDLLDETDPTEEKNNNTTDNTENLCVLVNSTNITNPNPLNTIDKHTERNKYTNLQFLIDPVKEENDEIIIYDSSDDRNEWAEHDEYQYNNILKTSVKKENEKILFETTAETNDTNNGERISFDVNLKTENVNSDTTNKTNAENKVQYVENKNVSTFRLKAGPKSKSKNNKKLSVLISEISKNELDVGNVLSDKCRLECCEDGDFDCDSYNGGSKLFPAIKSQNSSYSCSSFQSKDNVKDHFKYKCSLCTKRYNHLERFEIHKLTHEGQKESYECKLCNKTYKTWEGLKRHNDVTHIDSPLVQCTVCKKVLTNPASLKIHMFYHNRKDLMEVCDICGREMKRNSIMSHRETHKKDRKRESECQHCGKKFFNKTMLGTHVQRRHTGRKYVCHVCSLVMVDKCSLVKHLRRHQGIKPYSCNLCEKTFFTSGGKIQHMRVHSGEKPFVCGVCEKAFVSKNMLRDHHRIHTGERPNKCAVCGACFTQRGTLKRHMKIHKFSQAEA